ncbi:conjugal transfer protein TraN [Desulfurivibrio sp. D14AmB]|uniref:conjugal transfer protein TraN n=1 Tax=Desulfurivibrio sp. D14AmB TaxID=3374370 RepID=UPI00376EAA40
MKFHQRIGLAGTLALCLSLLTPPPSWADLGDLWNDEVCSKDLDGDDYLGGEGEVIDCINGVCPHDAVTCTPSFAEPTCPSGGILDATLDVCYRPVSLFLGCTWGYHYVAGRHRCERPPVCLEGTYDPDEGACYLGDYDCPHGHEFICADDGNGVNKCSPITCVDVGLTGGPEQTDGDPSYLRDDGEIDPETGACLGFIRIFTGRPGECQPPGAATLYRNCCTTTAADGVEVFPDVELMYCREESLKTAQAISAGVTHYVGEYCKTRIPLIGCIQKTNVYCVFNSKLARIINQQGRPQLHKFGINGGWGTPETPNCEGFSPEEFQMLDFSQIDLSEFTGDITHAASETVQQQAIEAMQDFFQHTQ